MDLMRIDPTRRLRTPAAILATAARVLADRPEASTGDIAAAAGVGRATLYRYFPTREALLEALEAQAHEELAARITDAGLDRVPVPEALERLLRAFLAVSDYYIVLVRELGKDRHGMDQHHKKELDSELMAPIRAVFQRGVDDGTFRDDLGIDALMGLFGGIVLASLKAGVPRTLGVEETAATVVSYFLDGARRRDQPPAG
jgi:TetR/AcrR family transcriptional regulator, mexCD-oprJ operon repressor